MRDKMILMACGWNFCMIEYFIMKESLYHKLIKYGKSDIYPFCMPGHKRNFRVPGIENPYDIDITEVEGFDNLQSFRNL